jgi:hypothetical protein
VSWKMMPSVWRCPERTRLTPWLLQRERRVDDGAVMGVEAGGDAWQSSAATRSATAGTDALARRRKQAPVNLEAGSDAAIATEYDPLPDSEPELARRAVRRGLRLGDTMRASAIDGLLQRFMSALPCSLMPQGKA